MSINRQSTSRAGRRGFTILELIVFIVIVAVALVGVLSVLNLTAQHNADPIIIKQMQAIAETYLEEVSSMPFTYCDPADANVFTATSTGGCATATNAENVAAMGPKNGETRGVPPSFNNVMDYGPSFVSNPASDINGSRSYGGYNVKVTVAVDGNLGPSGLQTPAAATLHITVFVTSGNNSLTLEGYRTRYAPNAVQ
jgi:MSHA pilin protein MshD